MKKRKKRVEINLGEIDVLNISVLKKYLSGDGKAAKIISRYVTGLSAQQQKIVAKAIKRARQLNLL